MKKNVVAVASLVLLAACASGPKERTFKKQYEVIDASTKSIPDWIENPVKAEKVAKDKKNYRYFVNESSHASKRLCEKSAETRATAHIAAEIAQFMKNTYSEATQGGAEEEVTEYMQEQLASNAQGFLVGTAFVAKYWEQRAYKEALGAEEDSKSFYCYAVVKMSKKDIEKAVERSKAKLLGAIEDPEVKKKTNEQLKDVSKAFAEHESPVKVEREEG